MAALPKSVEPAAADAYFFSSKRERGSVFRERLRKPAGRFFLFEWRPRGWKYAPKPRWRDPRRAPLAGVIGQTGDMDLAAQPHEENTEPELNDGDPPIHAIFRFLIAAVVTWRRIWAVATLAFSVFRDHLLIADVAYRSAGAVLLIGIYSLLLALLDHRDRDRLAAQGLPLDRLARRQFLTGLAFGMLLIAICVALVATCGSYQARAAITARTLRLGVEVLFAAADGRAAGRSHVPRVSLSAPG